MSEKFKLKFRRWFFGAIQDFVQIGRHDNHPETGARFAALAPKLFPRDPRSWNLYARALRSLDDEPRVLSVLKEGALRTNDAAPILRDIVISHLRLGHPRVAEEVMEHFKDGDGCWKHLSWAYIHADQHDWHAMASALDESMERAELIDLPDFQITAGILTASAPGGREARIELLQRALEAKEDLLGRGGACAPHLGDISGGCRGSHNKSKGAVDRIRKAFWRVHVGHGLEEIRWDLGN